MNRLQLCSPIVFFTVLVAFLCSSAAQGAGDSSVSAKPELVQEVLSGQRHEACVSWWGFDPEDSTKSLQEAINSKVKRLILDRQSSPWITRPLTGVSDQEIVFESGTELVALKGAFRSRSDCLLSFRECENVILRGNQASESKRASIRMHKQDYQSADYEASEWRHGLAFYGCHNVLVEDLRIEQTGGDAIYLGTGSDHRSNRHITIRRLDCYANHRQGISIINAEDLLIEDCLLRETKGTAPAAGIDFEPNHVSDSLVRCVVRRCIAENNEGTGFQICPQSLTSQSVPMSIHFDQCISRGNQQHAIHLVSNPNDPPKGHLQITGFLAENEGLAGLSVQFNPFDAVRVDVKDSIFRHCSLSEPSFPPLYLQGLDGAGPPTGQIHINNLTIEDDRDRPILQIRDRNGNGVKEMTGKILLKRHGQSILIVIDDAWLKTMGE